MQGLEIILSFRTNQFRVCQLFNQCRRNGITFQRCIMDVPLVGIGCQQREESVQSCTEADFQYVRGFYRRMFQSHLDKDMFRFCQCPFYGMIMFVQFRHEKGLAAIGCLFNLNHRCFCFKRESLEKAEDAQSGCHEQYVPYQFPQGHGESDDAYVGTHQSQYDEDSVADDGQKRKQCHPGTFPMDEAGCFVQLFLVHFQVFFYPFHFAQVSYPVAGQSAQSVSGGGGDSRPYGVKSQTDTGQQYSFRTEGQDGPCQEGGNEHTDVSPFRQIV